MAAIGSGIAYSFPSIIVPKNLIEPVLAIDTMRVYPMRYYFQTVVPNKAWLAYSQEFFKKMFSLPSDVIYIKRT